MGQAINEITIYKRDGSVRYKLNNYTQLCYIKSAEQKRELLGDDNVTLKTSSAVPLECSIGDYIIVYGSVYTLNKAVECTKTGERSFEQSYTFEGLQYKLLDAQFRNVDAAGYNPTASFSIVADMKLLMQVLITNANRVATTLGEEWALGDCPTTEYKEFTYSNQNCLNVLQSACEEFDTEFEIVQTSLKHYSLHIRKQGALLPATFDFTKQSGVYQLKRKNVSSTDIVTRLYVEGGTNNIGTSYRNGSERLRLEGESYVESATAIAAFGVKEGSKQYDDIYPHRTGTVTSVVVGNILQFIDTNMFDLNAKDDAGNTKYLIDGTSAKVKFTGTSALAGYEFEINKYDTNTHTFTLNYYEDKRGLKIPDGSAYAIEKGAQYVLLDIVMPQDPYVTDAEAELKKEAEAELESASQPSVEYELEIASMALERAYGTDESIVNVFQVGDLLHVKDADINVDKAIRIKSFTRDCYADPYMYKITLGDTIDTTLVERLVADVISTKEIIAINDLTNTAKARANWRTTQELLNMVFDSDGYFDTDNIKPNSIETMMLSVGNRAGQMVLRNVVIEANPVVSSKPQPNQLKITSNSGTLIHYAIEESDRTWQVSSSSITLSSTNAYYIYAKCAKQSTACIVVASQDKMAVDDGNASGYYYFLVGVLSSVYNSYRDITLTYGATRIVGRCINCGKIESVDGSTYFDLDNGEIGGNIKFKSGSTYKSVSTAVGDLETDVSGAQTSITNLNTTVSGSGGLTTQVSNLNTTVSGSGGLTEQVSGLNTTINGDGGLAAQIKANKQEIDAIEGNYTQIDGGLILSTYLKLGALLKSGVYQESAGVKAMLTNTSEVAAYFGGTLAEAIAGTKAGMVVIYHNGKFKADNAEIKGKVTATEGEFSGTLKGVTGTFTELSAVDSSGTTQASIFFSSDEGKLTFSGDMQHQGYNSSEGRSLRFLTSDVWCRGVFGHLGKTTAVVKHNQMTVYSKGANSSGVAVTLSSSTASDGKIYYKIPLYGTSGDWAGMPIDIVVFNNTSSSAYYYAFTGMYNGKEWRAINGNNSNSKIYFRDIGGWHNLTGGDSLYCVYVDPKFLTPTLTSSALGAGVFWSGEKDLDW